MQSAPPPDASPATLALVAAVARNGVIGVDGRLPWRLRDDLRHFRTVTTGHAIVMGRRTWQSIGRALPDRQNIVVTRQANFAAEGADIVASLAAALAISRLPLPVCCIGGGELYRAALPGADLLYMTEIDQPFAGDTYFPAYDRNDWREVARDAHVAPEGYSYAFVTYRRIHPFAMPSTTAIETPFRDS